MTAKSPTTGTRSKEFIIAIATAALITLHLIVRYGFDWTPADARWPLQVAVILGGAPLVWELLRKALRKEFGSDLIAGVSIVTSIILDEWLAGAFVVLMLSGGEALENYAVLRASSALDALARRMPGVAHKKRDGRFLDVALDEVRINDTLIVFPHEICPVDGVVVEGRGVMDESYLTGEPFELSKAPGSEVISGAINGDMALTIRATRLATDSRYARIMRVMEGSEKNRPRLRRLGDQLGAWYSPLAVAIALVAWLVTGEATRFLAVIVIATPCPLLIAIPVAIIGSISLAARRSVIIRDPAVMERVDQCRTIILDKTGTLTYGDPELTEQIVAPGVEPGDLLRLVASAERYSKHPLSSAILKSARTAGLALRDATEISERPGEGLVALFEGRRLRVTGRPQLLREHPELVDSLPTVGAGLECVILIDDNYVATYRFRDEPRSDSRSFIDHLGPKHKFDKIMIVSGDRESEVRHLADRVGIREIYAGASPEEKVEIVRRETAKAQTLYLGDGINDAPALVTATVGVAFGQNSDITTEAAGAVIMDTSLRRVDEFFHISRRMRRIALESAIGGMALSIIGMAVAAFGYLTPVGGAIGQEIIDLAAVLNALRVTIPTKELADY